jgi:putative sugar O-methyltransferase
MKRLLVFIIQSFISIFYNNFIYLTQKRYRYEPYNHPERNFGKENLVIWKNYELELHSMLNSYSYKDFLRWKVIQKTMFMNNHQICKKELTSLQQSTNWNLFWNKKLVDPPFGNPLRSFYRIQASCNTIHHAYHIEQYINYAGKNILQEINHIFEFGGGYGNFCRLIYEIGYKYTYTIYDLPQFSNLQKYYLSNTLSTNNWNCISDLEGLSFDNVSNKNSKTLFVATWSLSESPLELRNEITTLLTGCNYFLIAYQYKFSDIDNYMYFTDIFQKSFVDTNWINFEIPQLPGSFYLFGKPQKG